MAGARPQRRGTLQRRFFALGVQEATLGGETRGLGSAPCPAGFISGGAAGSVGTGAARSDAADSLQRPGRRHWHRGG